MKKDERKPSTESKRGSRIRQSLELFSLAARVEEANRRKKFNTRKRLKR